MKQSPGPKNNQMAMRAPNEYQLPFDSAPDRDTVEKVFDLVWRCDFASPGFCSIDLRADMDSHAIRLAMVAFKIGLSEVSERRGGRSFLFRSMARFDQQTTTKFHLDGAPDESLLILGYEPSNVDSRLFMADYTRAAFDLGVTPRQFLRDYNPMHRRGEDLLGRYVTEIPQQKEGHARILIVNNSSLPFTEGNANPLGVMHKAIIERPDAAQRRIINSIMLVREGEEINASKQEEFLNTNLISEKDY